MCQICNLVDRVDIIYPKIEGLKPKCSKWGLPHRTINCGLRCGYYTCMGHTENKCLKNKKETKSHLATNNYVEILMGDKIATLEQLNRLCGANHDIFSRIKRRLPMEMQTLKVNEANDKTIGFGPMDVMKEGPSCFF
jgi:hypothetical protein